MPKPPQLTLDQLLDAVPVKNEAVRVETVGQEEDERIVVYLRQRRPWWTRPPLGWVLPFREERGIALDRLGTGIYRACDGRRSVERIVEEFARVHVLSFHEARMAVEQFLKMMVGRNVLAVAVRESRQPKPSKVGNTTKKRTRKTRGR